MLLTQAVFDHSIRWFGEEERRFAIIMTHLAGMFSIVPPNAKNAPHRETLGQSGDGNRRRRHRVKNKSHEILIRSGLIERDLR